MSPMADGSMPSAVPSSIHPFTRSPTQLCSSTHSRTHSLTCLLYTHTPCARALCARAPAFLEEGRHRSRAQTA